MIAAGAASVIAVTELVLSFGTEVQWAALVVAVLFAFGASLIVLGRAVVPGLILVAALFAVELAFAPFYSRTGLGDWLIQGAVAVVSAVGLGSALAGLLGHQRTGVTHP